MSCTEIGQDPSGTRTALPSVSGWVKWFSAVKEPLIPEETKPQVGRTGKGPRLSSRPIERPPLATKGKGPVENRPGVYPAFAGKLGSTRRACERHITGRVQNSIRVPQTRGTTSFRSFVSPFRTRKRAATRPSNAWTTTMRLPVRSVWNRNLPSVPVRA